VLWYQEINIAWIGEVTKYVGDVEVDCREFCRLLGDCGVDFFVGVPCSMLGGIINFLSESEEVEYVSASREDEAIGIAFGAYIGGRTPAVLMQNSGLGVSVNALASLVQLYGVPILLIVSWRGYKGLDAPEHLKMGELLPKLLEVMDVPTVVLSDKCLKEEVEQSVEKMRAEGVSVALILRGEIVT
jgi:sulfopyruvate decarboxylase subunit alpha